MDHTVPSYRPHSPFGPHRPLYGPHSPFLWTTQSISMDHTVPSLWTTQAIPMDHTVHSYQPHSPFPMDHTVPYFRPHSPFPMDHTVHPGAQWLSGRALNSRPKGRGLEPHRRHCVVSLSKNINPSLVLVQPRKTRPFITERLLMGRKESNQTNKKHSPSPMEHTDHSLWTTQSFPMDHTVHFYGVHSPFL